MEKATCGGVEERDGENHISGKMQNRLSTAAYNGLGTNWFSFSITGGGAV